MHFEFASNSQTESLIGQTVIALFLNSHELVMNLIYRS